MTIKYQSGNRITGLSSDTKPTNVSTNSQFTETDTRNTFYYNGTVWVQPTFENMYEVFGSPKVINRQHVVEWFSGKQLPSYWEYNLANGTGGGAMADSVDGGYELTSTATGGTSESILTFNDKRQFSHSGATFICVAKSTTVNNALSVMETRGGFKHEDHVIFGSQQHAGFKTNTGNVNFYAYTASGSGTVTVDTGVYHDSAWHVWKGELKPVSFNLALDGIHRATSTTYLPTVKLQPYLYHYGYQPSAGSSTSSFRYYEAYNT